MIKEIMTRTQARS